jgi:predicted anti-sigma-YlaC factor YlaD
MKKFGEQVIMYILRGIIPGIYTSVLELLGKSHTNNILRLIMGMLIISIPCFLIISIYVIVLKNYVLPRIKEGILSSIFIVLLLILLIFRGYVMGATSDFGMSVLKIISYGLFVIYIEKKVFDFEREYF